VPIHGDLGWRDVRAPVDVPQLLAQSRSGVSPRLEPALEDDALRSVLTLGCELDQETRTSLGHVFADPALARLPSPWLGHRRNSIARPREPLLAR
jgi:hypothetical protein